MEPAAADPRVEKTREALALALMDLVAEGSWEALTVAALCRRARLHRATFYAHYEGKADLLARCLPTFYDHLVGDAPWVRLLAHCQAHRRFYRHALATGSEFRSLITDYLCRHALGSPLPPGAPPRSELAVRFGAGALVGVIEWFVTTEPPPDPGVAAVQLAGLMGRLGGVPATP